MIPRLVFSGAATAALLCIPTPSLAAADPPPPLYLQAWETGLGGWSPESSLADPLTLEAPAGVPTSGQALRVSRADAGAVAVSPPIVVPPGATVCLSARIRWASGGWPMVGLDHLDGDGTPVGESWHIGKAGAWTGRSAALAEVPVADGWQAHGVTVKLPAGTRYLRLKTRLSPTASRGGSHLAWFDDLGLRKGRCPQTRNLASRSATTRSRADRRSVDQGLPGGPALDALPGVPGVEGGMAGSRTALEGNLCPHAIATAPRVLECTAAGGAHVPLSAGPSSDPDGDALTFDWGFGAAAGMVEAFYTVGRHVARVAVSDGKCREVAEVRVQVVDSRAPDVTCPPPATVECGLDRDVPAATATDVCDGPLAVRSDAAARLEVGRHAVNWTAADRMGHLGQCTSEVEVVDTTPPAVLCNTPAILAAGAGPTTFAASAEDACCDVTTEVVAYDCLADEGGELRERKSACNVRFAGATVTVLDPGAAAGRVEWTVRATDCNGQQTLQKCGVDVRPALSAAKKT